MVAIPRRFPPPWSVEETEACFIVKDSGGQKLAYVYYEEEPGRRSAAKLLTKGEAADCGQLRQAAGPAPQAAVFTLNGSTQRPQADVRFTPDSGHHSDIAECPLCANRPVLVDIPRSLATGTYSVEAVAMGIPSLPVTVNIVPLSVSAGFVGGAHRLDLHSGGKRTGTSP
jgi:hypothetical protein